MAPRVSPPSPAARSPRRLAETPRVHRSMGPISLSLPCHTCGQHSATARVEYAFDQSELSTGRVSCRCLSFAVLWIRTTCAGVRPPSCQRERAMPLLVRATATCASSSPPRRDHQQPPKKRELSHALYDRGLPAHACMAWQLAGVGPPSRPPPRAPDDGGDTPARAPVRRGHVALDVLRQTINGWTELTELINRHLLMLCCVGFLRYCRGGG
jgi:hypothetical protein